MCPEEALLEIRRHFFRYFGNRDTGCVGRDNRILFDIRSNLLEHGLFYLEVFSHDLYNPVAITDHIKTCI